MKTTVRTSSARRLRRHFTPDRIQKYLRAFDRSGQSIGAFARDHDLVYSVLLRWLQRRSSTPGKGKLPRLREVPLGSLLGTARWAMEVVRPDGVTVRVAHDAPAGWVELLLGAC